MSSFQELDKLEVKKQRLILQIQQLNCEVDLKELELKETIKRINNIKNKNLGVLNN